MFVLMQAIVALAVQLTAGFIEEPRNDLRLHLYTKINQDMPVIIDPFRGTFDVHNFINFNPSNPNVFLTHGWKGNHDDCFNRHVRSAMFKLNDVNLFSLDWSQSGSGFTYFGAANNVAKIGRALGQFISTMMHEYNLDGESFRLIGFGLGAHVCGVAGHEVYGDIKYIVGLDPSGLVMETKPINERLDVTDAKFVEVIHTNGGFGGLGTDHALGHADFYANNGKAQSGCPLSFFPLNGHCNHERSYKYYAESLDANFVSFTCGNSKDIKSSMESDETVMDSMASRFYATKCPSYKEFKCKHCKDKKPEMMGGFDIDRSIRGKYYFDTEDQPPFALGESNIRNPESLINCIVA